MPSDDPTAELVLRARRGDRDAFTALVRAHLRAAYAVALSVVARPADAEDVAQDAFLIAFERLDSCRDPSRFAGWLLQIVRNQARNWLTKRRLRDVPDREPPREQGAESVLPDTVLRQRLLDQLALLSAAQREVVLLHDLDGWTHPEIAAALGFSEVMSRQHLFVARRQLRAQLGARTAEGVEDE